MTTAPVSRKPCIALMGEFSAGKSTLANLLIGADPLPVQVVATQLPPVWISHGDKAPYRADLDGTQYPVDLENLAGTPLDDTAYIRIFCAEDILLQCDLLDMPGISDPNMSSEVWQRMISKADGVLWCSPATQAWRQSEAAVWADMPPEFYERSLLLLTRIDKITSDRDRQKIVKRVQKETQGLFLECLPISLLQATGEQEDYEIWKQSGAGEFAKSLADLLNRLSAEFGPGMRQTGEADPPGPLNLPGFEAPEMPRDAESIEHPAENKVVPRRVTVSDTGQRPPE